MIRVDLNRTGDPSRSGLTFVPVSIKANSDYTLRVLLVSGVQIPSKQNCICLVRLCLILFYWFENQTHSKIDV